MNKNKNNKDKVKIKINKSENKNSTNIITKKVRFQKATYIALFVFIVLSILIGSFFSIYEGNTKNYDIDYQGGYGLNIIVNKVTFDSDGKSTSKPADKKQAIDLLQAKIDPLKNKNILYRFFTEHLFDKTETVVNIQTSRSTYNDNIFNFINSSTRPGYLYFMNDSGKDLLIDGDSRTPTGNLISSVTAGVNKANQNKPVVNLKIKDADTWNSKIIGSNPSSNDNPSPFAIWTDLAYFINDLRNTKDYHSFFELYHHFLSGISDDSKSKLLHKIFEYNDNDGKPCDLISQFLNIAPTDRKTFTNILKSVKNWNIKLSPQQTSADNQGTLQEGANSNSPKNTESTYVNVFSGLFNKILGDSIINKNNQYNKYRLAYESQPKKLDSNNIYSIPMESSSVSKQSASLINSGIGGLTFNLNESYDINPTISKTQFKVSVLIFLSFILGIIIFLITYYRLFGIIASLGLILIISLSYLLIGILSLEIGPALILAVLIIIFLNLDSTINFFEHFRKEHHNKSVSNTQAYKLSIKKTFLTVIDYHLIVLFLGLAIFIFSNNALRMFGISVILLSLISFFTYIFISNLLYFLVIKQRWLDDKKLLQMPKELKMNFKKNKNKEVHNNSKTNDLYIKNNKDTKIQIQSSIDKKDKKNKLSGLLVKHNKLNIVMFSFFSLILIISCLLFGISGVRFGQETINNYNSGTFFLLRDQSSKDKNSLNSDVNTLNEAIHKEFAYKFDYQVYSLDQQHNGGEDDYNIMISSNIKYRSQIENKLLIWLKSDKLHNIYRINLSQEMVDCKAGSHSYSDTVKQLFIIIGMIILITFIYIMIRFNWAQFIAVLGSLILISLLTILILNISQLWISIEMILAFLGVILYVIIDSIVLCSKIKYEKNKHKKDDFNNIYRKYIEYKHNKSECNKFYKNEYNKKYKELILSDKEFSNEELAKAKKKIKTDIKKLHLEKKKTLKEFKISYITKLKNKDINFLFDIKKTVIKDSIKRSLITSLIFTSIILILMISGGMSLGFGAVILVGINLAIFGSMFTLLFFWIIFDKFNILNSLRIDNFLKKHKLELDEEDIKGVNI